ncbi:hypothetical protein PCANC_03561 [Puccinia coronata f. sp. avenae]|uniref:Uncharacterized protein n=1 Tax=Puccinia coronata f. sp. avenae TaxID=200324 RepID=A0A2N5VV48_9BASI|nr:hypothetical protein PCASD_23798 [Puccinia coronata f. sp. avenae]PLW53832.1 hypothetical protein PCANC_03561 [Puccinia coronata f. sp. avenae]
MQLSNMPSFVSLLVTLPFAIICVSSSTPKLERRHEPHAPFTHMYIMKQPPDFTQGPLPVYTADGNVAFKFAKNYQDPLTGVSSTTLMDSSSDSHPLITLKSSNDACFRDTFYKEADSGMEALGIQLRTRGALKDEWLMSFYDKSNHQHQFKFVRWALSKGGRVYTLVEKHRGELIAKFHDEQRTDAWLTHNSKAVDTFTLECTANSPQVELVVLMGLVLTRVNNCGL